MEEIAGLFEGASEEEEAAAIVAAAVASGTSDAAVRSRAHCGRAPGGQTIRRGPCRWYEDYLSEQPTYPAWKFREVFRVPLKLCWVVHDELVAREPLLRQQKDALGHLGHSSHQKILAGLRRLATGAPYRDLDDHARMSPEALRISFHVFVAAMKRVFGPRYLNRDPTEDELRQICSTYEREGFPGCRGSVDCMHLRWKQCPAELKGQFKNPHAGKLATISCEGICDHDLYCWHWFCGRCGTNNDITVVNNSPFFIKLLSGNGKIKLPEGYEVNGVPRDWLLYFLADGIYPQWSIFVGPNHAPLNRAEAHMTQRQEAIRKDVERLFGCLQGRFKILRREWFEWDLDFVIAVSEVCVILHNMLVQLRLGGGMNDEFDANGVRIRDEGLIKEFMDLSALGLDDSELEGGGGGFTHSEGEPWTLDAALEALLERSDVIMDRRRSVELAKALTEHLWSLHSGN